jgi:hypothetical protein
VETGKSAAPRAPRYAITERIYEHRIETVLRRQCQEHGVVKLSATSKAFPYAFNIGD